MKAMILAAGRGVRLRPLTDATPKPLLEVCGKPLVEYHIERLVASGFTDIVINHSWLGDMIADRLGDGQRYGARIEYSHESEPLETGGGIYKALHYMEGKPFLVINGDVWTDYPFQRLPVLADGDLGHLVLVANPRHHANGDFCLQGDRVRLAGADKLTFSGIGNYSPALFGPDMPARFKLGSLLRQRIEENRISGEKYTGDWRDIGTPERLRALDQALRGQ